MLRRTFSKVVGSFILAPLVRLQTDIDPHKYLSLFTDVPDGDRRFDLKQPYAMAGHVYATDAMILARVEDCSRFHEDEKRKIPKETVEVWDRWFATAERKWRRPEPLSLVPDPSCYGGGCPLCEDNPPCDKCQGETYDLDAFSENEWMECRHCGGSGMLRNPACPLCHGIDDSGIPCLQPIGGKLVKGKYYMRLLKIPGLEINHASGNPEDPILFRSEIGIAGIVSCLGVARRHAC